MRKCSNKHFESNNNNLIKVNKINLNIYNSPILKKRTKSLLSKSNDNNNNNEQKAFIYKKSNIESQKSIYQNYNKNTAKIMTLGNSENKYSFPLFYNSPQKNLETINNKSYSSYRKNLRIKKKNHNNPVCQLYYKYDTNKNKKRVYNKTIYTGFFVKKNNENKNNSYLNNKNINNKKNSLNSQKTKLINTSSTSALSFSDSNKNIFNNNKDNSINNNKDNSINNNNNYTSHFSIDNSFERKNYIYKKAAIASFDCYSFDDNQLKERDKFDNKRTCNNKVDIMPLVTFGNDTNETIKISNNNTTSNKYIIKLKKENEFLKNALIRTNEKISLLENKIDYLIENKKNNTFKEKTYAYKKNSIFQKCPVPTPYVQKFTKKDFYPKEKGIIKVKVKLKSKDKIKPVIDRIFRNYERKGDKNKNSNNNFKNIKINNNNKIKPLPPFNYIIKKVEDNLFEIKNGI